MSKKSPMPTQRADHESASASRYPLPGLWRDGKHLVIDLTTHRFPDRCLISNVPVKSPPEPITLTSFNPPFLEVQRLDSDRRQLVDTKIRIIRGHRSGTRVLMDLKLPLSPFWQRIMRSPLGSRLIIAGLVVLGLFIVIQTLVRKVEPSADFLTLGTWLVVVALLFTGALVLLLQSLILPVHRLEERKIWVAGVHRDWLRDLPEFVPSRGILQRSIRDLLSRKWTSLGLCVFLWLLAVLAWLTTSPLDQTTLAVIVVLAAVSLAAAILGIYSHYEAGRQSARLAALHPEGRRKRKNR